MPNNKTGGPELVPDNPPADVADLIEKGVEAFGKVMSQNAAAQIEVAKINLPITQKNQAMQEELNRRHWDHVDEERKARIGNDRRIFYFALFVVAFLFLVASLLIYQNDKQNGMALISLVLGLVAGFLADKVGKRLGNRKELAPRPTQNLYLSLTMTN